MVVGAVYNTAKEKAKRTNMVNDKTSEMVKKKWHTKNRMCLVFGTQA